MGAVVKAAIPLAVGALVPMALPTVSPIVTGALSGAITSAVTGGNPLLGAATGALGGAVSSAIGGGGGGGLFGSSSPAAATSAASPSFDAFGGALGPGDIISGVPSAPTGAGLALSPSVSPTYAGTGMEGIALDLDEPFTSGLSQGASSSGFGDFLQNNKGEIVKTGAKLLGGFLSEEEPATGPAGDLAARQAGLAQAEFDTAQAQLNRRNVAADEIMGLSRSFDPEGAGRRAAESRLLAGARRAGQVDDQDRRRQAIQREIESRAAASVPAAFAAGREGAQRQQLAGLQGGASLIPAGLQSSRGFGTASAIQSGRAERERQGAMDVAGLFSPFFGSEDLRRANS